MEMEAKILEDLKKKSEILCLPCSKLEDHPLRMSYYAESHIEELSSSIKETGLLEFILVCPLGNGNYRVISGHYRLRAVRRLGWKNVVCCIINCDIQTSSVIYCTSNLLTRSLTVIEESHIITKMVKEENFSLTQIGTLWGHSKSWVSRRMSLMDCLSPRLKKDLQTGNLYPRTAQELLRLPQGNDQERVFSIVYNYHLNKDTTAELVGEWLKADEERKKDLEQSFNADVHINSSKNGYILRIDRTIKDCASRIREISRNLLCQRIHPNSLPAWEKLLKEFYNLESLLDDSY